MSGVPGHPVVAVCVLTWNQREKTLACLDHVLRQEGVPFRVIVWDNGSSDGTGPAIGAAHPEVIVHEHDSNLGVASGRNGAARIAIESTQADVLLFLDNDIEVEPGFIAALVEPFSDPRVGQTQAKLRFARDRARLNDGGGCRIQFWRGRTVPVGFGEIDRGQRDQRRPCIACGGAMATRTAVFQELGGFDSGFDPVGPEDLDYSIRLQRAGYTALYVPQAVGYHEVSHSFGDGAYTEAYAKHKARNWMRFLRRHAPLHEKLVFLGVSAPLLAARLVIREGLRGNFGAVRGLGRGLLEILRGRRAG